MAHFSTSDNQKVPTRLLPSAVPLLGFGTFNEFTDADKVAEAVRIAIRTGYRHFDLAKLYENEEEIGTAIRGAIADGEVTREELFICSKLWCTDHAPKDVFAACKGSLKRTGLDYLDCYMMHWPTQWTKESHRVSAEHGGGFKFTTLHMNDRTALRDTYAAMETLVDAGLTRSLGVSNFDVKLLSDLLEDCTIAPVTNEVEMHPFLPQRQLVAFCKSKDITVVAYSPLGKVGYRSPGAPNLLENATIVKIAEKLGRTPGQIVLRWGIQRGTSVIPKSLTPSRIRSNFNVFQWQLSQEDMEVLDTLDRAYRFVEVPWYSFDEREKFLEEEKNSDSIDRNRLVQGVENMMNAAMKSGMSSEDLMQLLEDSASDEGFSNPFDGRTSRSHSTSSLADQPLYKPGRTDKMGFYRNSFGREGKPLNSEIYVKRGVIKDLDKYAKTVLPISCHEAPNFVITDEILDSIVATDVLEGVRKAGIKCEKIVVPADMADEAGETSGEPYKNSAVFQSCVDQILQLGINKHSCIISVGGGVVNNMCGVLAGMIYRGITLVHFTTTTMGMLDAALDFKQAINHDRGKNLLGCYYPAQAIVIDPDCCSTLSTRHVRNGIAEALKHGFTQSSDMVDMIVDPVFKHGDKKLHDGDYLLAVCQHCIEIKCPTLDNYHCSDFNEMCPQYGHAIGHAVEHLSWKEGHEPLLHGEAVAIGMCVSAEIALRRDICDQSTVDAHYKAMRNVGLPCYVPATMSITDILHELTYDKHFVKTPAMGLCSSVGVMAEASDNVYAHQIEVPEIEKAVDISLKKGELAAEVAAAVLSF